MKEDNANWKRLSEVIRVTGHNINSFARHIGLLRGENLYQIQRGNNGISEDVARRIHNHFPQYSVAWIMFGEENVAIMTEQGDPVVRIPLYQDIWSDEFPPQEPPDDYLVLSASVANNAELAVPYSDDILNPFLRGAILLLKQHRESDVILCGNIYLVDLRDMRLFRIVKKHNLNPESLCFATIQPAVFGDMVIPIEHISGLWRVVGAVCNMER